MSRCALKVVGDEKGVLVYSGGMDSTVLLYLLHRKRNVDACISFNYGSKHNEREISFARKNAEELGIEHHIIDMRFLDDVLESDLLSSGGEVPEGHYEAENMKSTVVPFRNGIMLSVAVGIAESRGLNQVFYAAHLGDHAIYPDCRPAFQEAMDWAATEGTYNSVNINAPFLALDYDKRDIGVLGYQMNLDYNKTWSCYKGKEIHCGKCGTCVERKEALEGFDPTEYEDEK